jgi:hypothetical protein
MVGGDPWKAINKRRRTPVTDSNVNLIAPLESDAVRIYVSWNTNLKHLFGKDQI